MNRSQVAKIYGIVVALATIGPYIVFAEHRTGCNSEASMRLIDDIAARFGPPAVAARAPGRVNLIGDHVDYCGGLVMPFAINRDCVAAIHTDVADDRTLVLCSLNEQSEHAVPWIDVLKSGGSAPVGSWQSYVLGVIAGLGEVGAVDRLRGCRIVVATDVPMGSGLSSSAALEVSVAVAAASRCGIDVGDLELAKLCQHAEHRFAGVPCGLMDQAISVLGRAGHLLILDCATDFTEHVPIPSTCELIVINSGVGHALADGEYGKRRASCEKAAEALGIRHLAHAEADALRSVPADLLPHARHVVSETARVRALADALAAGDLAECGRLVHESHVSLRDDFRVSCDEIDLIVETLCSTEGVYGARMTGGGFGGCVIGLAAPGFEPAVRAAAERCRGLCPNIEVIPVTASDGAERITDVVEPNA
ncbi:MAG: galactokinase [Planctomycetota bacterium]